MAKTAQIQVFAAEPIAWTLWLLGYSGQALAHLHRVLLEDLGG